ncbi:MAG: FAD-dependent oxidoreductase [Betaproteobacteria bacterium]|jgi:thioredoxin reductase (NADPH)|nr:FAD-dependent oxidoreductase [Betaproteobacteria bacterium]MDH5341368.1 FAD-dependent oxidoreductase [Betaproteobacteria bacterium]
MSTSFDVIVIGEGIAGLTAAGALARHGLNAATFEQQIFGGLVLNVNELHPAPAGAEAGGAAFAAEMTQANADAGVTSVQEPVTAISASNGKFTVTTGSGSYVARQIVVASGARLKTLGIPGEAEFEGRGVSKCADCDGPMFQNETVAVVGGGDSALQEALVLSQYCAKVHLIHRGSAFSAQPHFIEQVKASDKIVPCFGTTVEAALGGQMVEKLRIRTAAGSEEIPCAGLFVYIGLEPNNAFLPADVQRNANGFITTGDALETSVGGIWAAGAVRAGCGGSLDDAMADATRVADAIAVRLK